MRYLERFVLAGDARAGLWRPQRARAARRALVSAHRRRSRRGRRRRARCSDRCVGSCGLRAARRSAALDGWTHISCSSATSSIAVGLVEALDLLERLEKDASRRRRSTLLGAARVMRMSATSGARRPASTRTFDGDVGGRRNEYVERAKPERCRRLRSSWLRRDAAVLCNSRGKWLRFLAAVVQINGVVFVHGGISPAIAICHAIPSTKPCDDR
jgi:hypothetical protein